MFFSFGLQVRQGAGTSPKGPWAGWGICPKPFHTVLPPCLKSSSPPVPQFLVPAASRSHSCLSPPFLQARLLAPVPRDPGLVGAFARSLAAGELSKALACSSVSADIAIAAILAAVCDPHGVIAPAIIDLGPAPRPLDSALQVSGFAEVFVDLLMLMRIRVTGFGWVLSRIWTGSVFVV